MVKHPESTPIILWSPFGTATEQDCACPVDKVTPTVLWSPPGEQAEDDCACSATNLTPTVGSSAGVETTWQTVGRLYRTSLPDNHTLVFNPFGPAGVIVLNGPAQTILNSFATPQRLTGTISRQLAALGLLQPQGVQPVCPSFQPDTLTAWLHVTNACNLRCTYCYLDKTEEAMDEATGQAAIEAIFRSAMHNRFRAVKLKYAGGEATLNFSLVRILHEQVRLLAKQTGLELREVVLSNGVTLGHAILDFIRDTDIQLMISLDGVGASHDSQRIFANGRGSFSQVERGIERALKRGVQPHLSVTVTGQNAARVAEVVAFALDRDLLFNLNFYRDNDYARNREEWLAEDERLLSGMKAALAVIEDRLPQQSLIAALVDRSNFGGLHQHPCGAGHNYLVIDQRGRVARCHMEIERTITDVFVDADPLAAVKDQPIGFDNLSVDEKEGCRECEWRYWCAGGCPLLTYRVTGHSDVKSPYCSVYKALYPEVLRLEGLRLLKWQETLPN